MTLILFVVVAASGLLLLILGEVWLAMHNRPANYYAPDAGTKRFGQTGQPLRYVVLGDSTAAGVGAKYEDGIAVGTGMFLGEDYRVEMINLAVSGARTASVAQDQLPRAVNFRPDLVLISVGANDVVAQTLPKTVQGSLEQICNQLIQANCNVKIVLTASPEMGAIPRFAQPLRALAGLQTSVLNRRIIPWINKNGYTLAPIAATTGPVFKQNPSLFADDWFHPNAEGYAVWLKTINPSLKRALTEQASHCKD